MDKKQTVIKTICIILTIGIICFFFIYFQTANHNTTNGKTPIEDNKEKPITPDEEEKDKLTHTTFPKPSSLYKQNSRLINIGGTSKDKYLKSFVLKDEIILLAETSSTDFDFNSTETTLSVAILNKNIDLLSTKNLEGTIGKKYITSTLFADGIFVLVSNDESSSLLLYDYDFNLKQKLNLEPIQHASVIATIGMLKLLTYSNNSICIRELNESLNIVAFANATSKSEGFYQSIINYKDYDVFVNIKSDSFDIFKISKKYESDKIYYVIDRICTINGVLCQLIPKTDNNNKLILSYIKNNKAEVICLDTYTNATTITELNIASNYIYLVPLDYGYILQNYMDNSISILDSEFRIIIANLKSNTDVNIIKSYYHPSNKQYDFLANSLTDNTTLLYTLDYSLQSNPLLEIPRVENILDIKVDNNARYIFFDTKNNIGDFRGIYGASDIFVIKLCENL